MYKKLKRIESEVDDLRRYLVALAKSIESVISSVNARISSLERVISDLAEALERVEADIQELNARINSVRAELMREISETREYLDQRIEGVRKDLTTQINATKAYLEGKIAETEQKLNTRIRETEQRLDKHLAEQDRVLEIHGEGLLGSAVMQLVNTLTPEITATTHAVIGQFNSHPLIVVEGPERVRVIYVVKEEDQSITEQIKTLALTIRRYTGKDVEVSVVAMKPKEGMPLWLAGITATENFLL